ncbi:putative AC transposase [Purpureocillium lavendulum]|uniref:AC transposase n=1 Tax=Purpureocillium lavendulum TaxID=1247861 RepID=A0AB34FEU1_9HYPO|nr:putative AC transposase [Purpureocillium lavendulum]
MFFALIFVCTRISQIVTLIPMMGMLAWFINIFVTHNALTPDPILILFITSVLALAWAVFTLFSYHRSSANARLVALVDLGIFGTLIAGVYLLRGIADADCSDDPSASRWWTAHVAVPAVVDWAPNKPCAMLKASWAFAIMNIIFFFTTAVAAFSHGDSLSAGYGDERVVRTRHTHYHHGGRHGHRHHSRSRSGGSHRSHSHSRRVYV